MPYCSGGDLYGNIAAGQTLSNLQRRGSTLKRLPSEDQARQWFQQLLQGLFHLQKKGICHRDISVDNLMLDGNGELMIIDFGLALRVPYTDASNPGCVSDLSEGSHRLLIKAQGQSGNIMYLAPEIVERTEAFDGFTVDLWSAGICLFVFLVGRAPFKWAHPTDVRFSLISKGHLREVMQDQGTPLSCKACDLLQKMFLRDPRKRLNLAQVMNHPWVAEPAARVQEQKKVPHAQVAKLFHKAPAEEDFQWV
jgi:serine/threonine protein kinase